MPLSSSSAGSYFICSPLLLLPCSRLTWTGVAVSFCILHRCSQITFLKKPSLSTHHTLSIPWLLPVSFVIFLWLLNISKYRVRALSTRKEGICDAAFLDFYVLRPWGWPCLGLWSWKRLILSHSILCHTWSLDACSCEGVTPSSVDLLVLLLLWCGVNGEWCSAACGGWFLAGSCFLV